MIAMELYRLLTKSTPNQLQRGKLGQGYGIAPSDIATASLVLNLCRKQPQGDEFENYHGIRPAFSQRPGFRRQHIFKAKSAGFLLRRPAAHLLAQRPHLSCELALVKFSGDSRISAYLFPKRLCQMIHYLSPMEIVLWACTAAGQTILAFLLLRSAAIHRYPAFCFYVFYGALKSYLLLYIALSFSTIAYFWWYYPASFLGCLLMVPVVMEIFLKVYGSSRALPTGTIGRLRRWLFACGVARGHCRSRFPGRTQRQRHLSRHGNRGKNADSRRSGFVTCLTGLFHQAGPLLANKDCRSCPWLRSISKFQRCFCIFSGQYTA